MQVGRRAEGLLVDFEQVGAIGRKMHAEGATTVFCKSAKRTRKLTKYGFFGSFAPFLDDVSMTSPGGSGSDDVSLTSSGDVATHEWFTVVMRWQTSGAMADGGCGRGAYAGSDAALT